MSELEEFWADLLSRDPERIYTAWESLNDNEQAAIYIHLMQMTSEDDWSEPQRWSAEVALEVLQDQLGGEDI